jgi:agmatinase
MNQVWERAFTRAAAATSARVDRRMRAILRDDIPTFMELPQAKKPADLAGVEAAFLGMPYEGVKIDSPHTYLPDSAAPAGPDSIYYRTGADEAPAAIRRYSIFYSIAHSNGLFPEIRPDFTIFDHLTAVDYGDVPTVRGDPESSFAACQRMVGEIVEAGAVPLIFGGDHAVPTPVMKALAPRTKGNIGLIVFDSHYDLSFEPYHYAGSQWARALEQPNIKPQNLVLVGIRGLRHNHFERFVAQELGIPVLTKGDIDRRGLEPVVDEAIERAGDGTEALYVSLDIDVMDPPSVPAQRYPEPDGLTTRQMVEALRRIGAARALAGFDICCLGPQYDLPTGISAHTCARFYVEILATLAQHKAVLRAGLLNQLSLLPDDGR